MAYKFQLGKARMSGSLEQEGDLTVASGAGDDVIGVESSLGSGIFLAQLGFDGSTNTGKLEIADGASGGTVFSVLDILSGSAMNTLAGDALAFNQSSGVMDVNVDSSTIEVSSDALQLVNAGVSNAKLANLAQGSIKVGDGSNRPSDLDAKTSGRILVGNGTTIASVAVQGDVTMVANGTVTIGNDKVGVAQLKSSEFAQGSIIRGDSSGDPQIFALGAANRILQSDGSDLVYAQVANAGLANSSVTITPGDGLKNGGSVALGAAVTLDIDVSDFAGTGLEDDSSENLRLSAQGTGIAGGAGSVLSIDPAQTGINSLFSTTLKLGYGSSHAHIDFGTDDKILFDIDDTLAMEVNGSGVVIAGDLHVQGSTTTVDSTTINISSSFTFEGPVDAHQTNFSCGTPSQDNEIFLPQFSGSAGGAQYHMAVLADATTHAAASVTAAEFALLDGSAQLAAGFATAAPVAADGFLHNDNGTLKHTTIGTLISAVADNGLSASGVALSLDIAGISTELSSATIADTDQFAIDDNGTLSKVDFQYVRDSVFADVSGDITITAGGDVNIGSGAISTRSNTTSLTANDQFLTNTSSGLRRTPLSAIATFVGNNASATVQELTNATQTLSVTAGPMVLANRASAMTITLDSPSNHEGKRIVIKKIGAGNVTISPPSGQIDGQALDIVLESPMAAVTIISDGTNYFIV
jgi:hypothetical protein